MEAGLDSLGAIDLRNALAAQFSLELPPTVTFDYPTIPSLAHFIASRISQESDAPSGLAEPSASVYIEAIRYTLSASC